METKSDLNVPAINIDSPDMVVSEPKFVAENLEAHDFLIVTTRLDGHDEYRPTRGREVVTRGAGKVGCSDVDEHGVSQLL